MRTKKLYVFRGLPGSGKTTEARSLGCLVVDPDCWHVQDGVYKWTPQAQSVGFLRSWAIVEEAMRQEFDIAVPEVLHIREMVRPLLELGQKYDYEVIVIDKKCSAEESIERNVHGVRPEDIRQMAVEWEDWDV